MRSANRLLGVLGRDVELRIHLPSTKFEIRYLVDSHTLIALSEMRHEILNRNQTTWANTDTRISPKAFYEPTHNHQIDIREVVGIGGGFNDFTERLCNLG